MPSPFTMFNSGPSMKLALYLRYILVLLLDFQEQQLLLLLTLLTLLKVGPNVLLRLRYVSFPSWLMFFDQFLCAYPPDAFPGSNIASGQLHDSYHIGCIEYIKCSLVGNKLTISLLSLQLSWVNWQANTSSQEPCINSRTSY